MSAAGLGIGFLAIGLRFVRFLARIVRRPQRAAHTASAGLAEDAAPQSSRRWAEWNGNGAVGAMQTVSVVQETGTSAEAALAVESSFESAPKLASQPPLPAAAAAAAGEEEGAKAVSATESSSENTFKPAAVAEEEEEDAKAVFAIENSSETTFKPTAKEEEKEQDAKAVFATESSSHVSSKPAITEAEESDKAVFAIESSSENTLKPAAVTKEEEEGAKAVFAIESSSETTPKPATAEEDDVNKSVLAIEGSSETTLKPATTAEEEEEDAIKPVLAIESSSEILPELKENARPAETVVKASSSISIIASVISEPGQLKQLQRDCAFLFIPFCRHLGSIDISILPPPPLISLCAGACFYYSWQGLHPRLASQSSPLMTRLFVTKVAYLR